MNRKPNYNYAKYINSYYNSDYYARYLNIFSKLANKYNQYKNHI